MKIVIPGGSGQVGTMLARAFHKERHEVVVLTRNGTTKHPWRTVKWDGCSPGEWVDELNGATAVINLAGRSVNCRYDEANRREIINSRVQSTLTVAHAIAASPSPPPVWLQASTATIYAHRYDAANDEPTGILGGDEPDVPATWHFSTDVAKAWEAAVTAAGPLPQTRTVLLRSALTLSPDPGGIFATLLGLVQYGLGGTAGNGRQYVSWIHEDDFVRAVKWLIENETLSGPVNLASPNPLPNAEFMRTLRTAWGSPIGIPAAKWMLEIGASLMKTETELILKSRRVIPSRLLQNGFQFRYPRWHDAAKRALQTLADAPLTP